MIKTEDMKLSDQLAVERTVMAADRTILGGVRTALSFIGFGFTIAKVLRYLQENAPIKLMRPETPRNFGIFMLAAGTIPLIFMLVQYYRTLQGMGRKGSFISNPNVQMAGAVCLLGTILLVTLIWSVLQL